MAGRQASFSGLGRLDDRAWGARACRHDDRNGRLRPRPTFASTTQSVFSWVESCESSSVPSLLIDTDRASCVGELTCDSIKEFTFGGGELSAAANPQVRKLFDETRRRLVETGTRNRLVHVNRANTRGAVVNIEDERSDDVYQLLSGGRTMRLRPLGKDRHQQGEILLAGVVDESKVGADESRYTDNQLDTLLGPDALGKKLLKIARDARTAEEEQGVNILYLALGFVTWFEDEKSDVRREAPLVLLPVELVRNQRTSTYDLRMRSDDLMTNLPLQQRWQDDFGLVLPDLEIDDNWRPSDYFDQVDAIVGKRARWSIERNGMQLGFFSFSKLLMYRDLDLDAWPDGNLENHDLVRGLLYEGFGEDQSPFGDGKNLDAVLPPEIICHVVDADASQAKVIEEARRGKNLVVQGPPGTGKSQTIANIIAAAAKEGKSVLFVAEKMAALEVVHDRLVKVGLADICLELHSRTANKRQVLEELKRTLNAGEAIPAMPEQPDTLRKTRDELNAIAQALHAPAGETGETAFRMLSRQARYIGLGAQPPTFASPNLSSMDRAAEQRAVTALTRYGAALEATGDPAAHPLRGVRNTSLQPVDQARLRPLIEGARGASTVSGAQTGSTIAIARSLASVTLSSKLGKLSVAASFQSENLRIRRQRQQGP